MQTLRSNLKRFLEGAARLAVMGIGSDIRCDDAAGLIAAGRAAARAAGHPRGGDILSIECHTAPENFTGELVRFVPTHVVLFDAADFGAAPGSVSVIAESSIGGESFSTHRMPMGVFVKYLRERLGCAVCIVAVQPRSLELCVPPGDDVRAGAEGAADAVMDIFLGA